jgi:hypothetical protein
LTARDEGREMQCELHGITSGVSWLPPALMFAGKIDAF